MKQWWAPLVGVVLIILIVQGLGLGKKSIAGPMGKGPTGDPMIRLVWQAKTSEPTSIVSSPDGNSIATVADGGKITCFDTKGQVRWAKTLEGATTVALGPDGSAIAASVLSPAESLVYFLSPKGEILWKHDVGSAIWSIDASPEPGKYAVGVGDRLCYVYTVTARRHRYRRWRVPGAPVSVKFTAEGKSIVIGTWQDAGVGVFGTDGEREAWWSGRSDRLYWAEPVRGGSGYLVIAKPNPDHAETTVHLKSQDMNDVWSKDFAYAGLASDASSDGGALAIGFRHVISHNAEEISEKRIALYDGVGQVRWEKGGSFGEWDLLQVCESGRVLIYDDSPSLSLMSESGRVQLRTKLPARIKSFGRTPRRDRIALYLASGQLAVYAVR